MDPYISTDSTFVPCIHPGGEFDSFVVVNPAGGYELCCSECAERFDEEGRETFYAMGEEEERFMNAAMRDDA